MNSKVPQFAEGELVTVTIKGARVDAIGTQSLPSVILQTENQFGEWKFEVPTSYPGVDITRVAPAEWPPQTGDIWKDPQGRKWVGEVVKDDGGHSAAALTWLNGDYRKLSRLEAGYALENHGPFTLLYREGWSPAADTTSAATEPEQVDRRASYIAGLRELADLLETRSDLPLQYPGEVSWLVRDKAQVDQWVEVLGTYQQVPDGATSMHHWAKGKLAGLAIRAAWIEDLPKPADEPSIEEDAFDATCGPVPELTDPFTTTRFPTATEPLPSREPTSCCTATFGDLWCTLPEGHAGDHYEIGRGVHFKVEGGAS